MLTTQGDQSENGPSGDLLIRLSVGRHPRFRKAGEDIHSTEWLTISQAALGTSRAVETVWGRRELVVPQGAQDGQSLVLKGEVGLVGLRACSCCATGATTWCFCA